MDIIWALISLIMEFGIVGMIISGIVGAIVAIIIYKTFKQLLNMFS